MADSGQDGAPRATNLYRRRGARWLRGRTPNSLGSNGTAVGGSNSSLDTGESNSTAPCSLVLLHCSTERRHEVGKWHSRRRDICRNQVKTAGQRHSCYRGAHPSTDAIAGHCIANDFADGVADCRAVDRRGEEADPKGTTADGAALLRNRRERSPSPKPTNGRHGRDELLKRRALRGPCGAGPAGSHDQHEWTCAGENRGALRASLHWVGTGASSRNP